MGRVLYNRGKDEVNHQNGSYEHNFTLKGVGEVQIKVSRDRRGGFRTHVVPHSKQYVEEISRYFSLLLLTGISTRSLSMISKRLVGHRISPAEVSTANVELAAAVRSGG
jgi:transposase-like protein